MTIGHFVMSRNEPFPQNLMPFCLLLVSVLLPKFVCQKIQRSPARRVENQSSKPREAVRGNGSFVKLGF